MGVEGLLITAVKESLVQKGGLPHEPRPPIAALLTLNPDVLVLILSHFSSALRFNFSAASSERAGDFFFSHMMQMHSEQKSGVTAFF